MGMSSMDLIFHILKTSCMDLNFPMDTQLKEAASFGTEGTGLEEAAQILYGTFQVQTLTASGAQLGAPSPLLIVIGWCFRGLAGLVCLKR